MPCVDGERTLVIMCFREVNFLVPLFLAFFVDLLSRLLCCIWNEMVVALFVIILHTYG